MRFQHIRHTNRRARNSLNASQLELDLESPYPFYLFIIQITTYFIF